MYKFIKVKLDNWDNARWYFVPQSVEQIEKFFDTIIHSVISDGIRDYMENGDQPATTVWRKSIDALCPTGGLHWLETSLRIENETIQNRINDFLEGKEPIFSDGVAYMNMSVVNESNIIEDIETENLVFPSQYNIKDVRYMQWGMPGNKGIHWYAKIGNMDIRDEEGNMKWCSKVEAEKAAEYYVNKLNTKK